jgi:hypothetical protein
LSEVVGVSGGGYHTVAVREITPVSVTSQPVAQTVTVGQSATFSVTAGGTDPLSYQWLKDGKILTGATNSAYTISSTGIKDVGFYRVRVGNAPGSVISRAALLMVSSYDGTVVAWGDNTNGQTTVPTGLSGVVSVDAGIFHTVALKSDGTVVAWGGNTNGQTTVPAGLSEVVGVAGGFEHTVALKSDGTVVAWGLNTSGQTTVPAGLSEVVGVAAGGYHTVALKRDGTVVAWGDNTSGQTTVPNGLSEVVGVSGGGYHTVAVREITPVFVTSQPVAQTVTVGQTATFSVTATGPEPLSYQWRKDGLAVAGATNATLTITQYA